jgi:hypothetical protein
MLSLVFDRTEREEARMRRAVVVALGVVASIGALAAPADAKLPKTSQVEKFVVKHAPDKIFAAYANCDRSGPHSWTCDIVTNPDTGNGNGDGSYHVTARYISGRLYAGRYVKN